MKVRFRRHGDIVIFDLSGELIGSDGHTLRTAFERALGSREIGAHPRILANLDGVIVMDSSALGALVYAHTHTTEKQGRFCLTGVSERLSDLLSLSQLSSLLPQYPDEAAAIQYLES
jgi:anti-anti-sigma factor